MISTAAARVMVGTEPKLGEFHKETTRMFYMAEQGIKAITQRCERLARQISRKQAGVSITKDFKGARLDIEKNCRSMTGPDAENRAAFVSFDLSEFSKTYPQKLLRAYGEILSEITGEEWLKRIDIVFRSSMVIHNTRGFADVLTGVSGGFEGFFNFIWSSSHAIIMEIALDAIGLSGEILTYSDDGLLYFISPKDKGIEFVREKVLRIVGIYKEYGLVFNVKKTFISFVLWEYLGSICY